MNVTARIWLLQLVPRSRVVHRSQIRLISLCQTQCVALHQSLYCTLLDMAPDSVFMSTQLKRQYQRHATPDMGLERLYWRRALFGKRPRLPTRDTDTHLLTRRDFGSASHLALTRCLKARPGPDLAVRFIATIGSRDRAVRQYSFSTYIHYYCTRWTYEPRYLPTYILLSGFRYSAPACHQIKSARPIPPT